MWEVYSDGSGTTGGPAGIGFVAYEDGRHAMHGKLPLENATNQQAELLAAAYALHSLPPGQTVTVFSDSEYVVKWVVRAPVWRENDWSKGPGRGKAKNPAHWARLLDAIARHEKVVFEWCAGHAGVEGNEFADRLAGEARRMAQGRFEPVNEEALLL